MKGGITWEVWVDKKIKSSKLKTKKTVHLMDNYCHTWRSPLEVPEEEAPKQGNPWQRGWHGA